MVGGLGLGLVGGGEEGVVVCVVWCGVGEGWGLRSVWVWVGVGSVCVVCVVCVERGEGRVGWWWWCRPHVYVTCLSMPHVCNVM